MKNVTQKQNKAWQKMLVRNKHQLWLEDSPKGTLGELLAWLEEAYEECLTFVSSDDPVIEETDDIPPTLADYLSAFDDHDGEQFSYREANLEEDIQEVEELIEELGKGMRLAKLPKLKFSHRK